MTYPCTHVYMPCLHVSMPYHICCIPPCYSTIPLNLAACLVFRTFCTPVLFHTGQKTGLPALPLPVPLPSTLFPFLPLKAAAASGNTQDCAAEPLLCGVPLLRCAADCICCHIHTTPLAVTLSARTSYSAYSDDLLAMPSGGTAAGVADAFL